MCVRVRACVCMRSYVCVCMCVYVCTEAVAGANQTAKLHPVNETRVCARINRQQHICYRSLNDRWMVPNAVTVNYTLNFVI